MDYEKLEQRNIRYSKDIYFLNYESIFELWLDSEKIGSFNSIREVNLFLFNKYVSPEVRGAKKVYVYTVYFDELYEILKKNSKEIALKVTNYKKKTIVEAFQIYGGITFKNAKYYLGTDKVDDIDPANYCGMIKSFHNANIKHSFTTSLKDAILSKEMEEFGNKENLPNEVMQELYNYASLAPIIYSDINKEFTNVYCYDFDSAYVDKYFKCRYPTKFKACSVSSKNAVLLRLRIKNIKAKNPRFCCLSVADKSCGEKIICPTLESKRVLMAKEVVISVFRFEMKMIEECYTYDEIIVERAWTAELRKLPKCFLDAVLETYQTKENAKRGGVPYADKKVLLNRIHGFFITKKENLYVKDELQPMYAKVPMQIGFFTIALQRMMMYELIKKVGLENIVSAHTDSIKTKGNYETIIKEWNETYKNPYSDTMGVLEFEGIMEKVVYFSNTRAKYIMNGEFKIKHGGIWLRDAEDILNNYTYDSLNKSSSYQHTIKKVFRGKEEGMTYLKRIQENRVFSEGDDNDEQTWEGD